MESYVGRTLDGRYKIEETVGVGGMAVVYKAYDSIDDRTVAVKILKDEYLANEEFRRRFKNESKAIAVLSHPNIVKVYDVSYGDKLQYIIMEYVEGITLKEYIESRGKIAWRDAVHFITQILRALQHAHDKGIVHRDVKPQNIMMLQNGTIKVTDFGIARFSRSETRTMSDNAIGSVHYISPEQARGDITDDKADIYSLGVVMYEMLTGQLPFQSDNSVSVAIMQLQAEPKRPCEINPEIPPGLEQITMRAMQKNKQDRYQSAAEMLLDLDEFRRNPDIEFGYKCFVDNDPTKFVGKTVVSGALPVNEVNEPETEEEPGKSKTMAILLGAGAGLIVVVLLIVGAFALFTDMFKDDKLVVPNFVNKNYEEDIKDNPLYDMFMIETIEEQNSTFQEGSVFKQDPASGSKINPKEKITLTIAVGTKMITVPNVYNLDFAQAKNTLENLGFRVSEVPELDASVAFGTVLRTTPEQGTEAPQGSTILVYYASDENLVEVPVLLDFTVDVAKRLLESMDLQLDENVLQEDSQKEAGTIIRQSFDAMQKVAKGTKIAVTISTGIPPEASVRITVKLPSKTAGVTGKVMATLNNEIVMEKNVLLDGNNYSFDIVGSGPDNRLKVFVDSQPLYECKIDFTKVPAKLSEEKTYVVSSDAAVPKLTGLTEMKAREALIKIGFNNISVINEVVSDASKVGIVLEQSPEYQQFFPQKYPLDTQIVLKVGAVEESTTPDD